MLKKKLPQPDIFTESGRAMTAHHAVLITDVTDIESIYRNESELQKLPEIKNPVEAYHDSHFNLSQAREKFAQDQCSLTDLAKMENVYSLLCQKFKHN